MALPVCSSCSSRTGKQRWQQYRTSSCSTPATTPSPSKHTHRYSTYAHVKGSVALSKRLACSSLLVVICTRLRQRTCKTRNGCLRDCITADVFLGHKNRQRPRPAWLAHDGLGLRVKLSLVTSCCIAVNKCYIHLHPSIIHES